MAGTADPSRILADWVRIPETIERAIAGLGERELDWRGEGESLSIREIVHHVVESNLVASNIVLAALAAPEPTFDWSWVQPGGDWMRRLGYAGSPIGPAIEALRALGPYVANLIRSAPGGFERSVRLLDEPGAVPYSRTVPEVLVQEIEHAAEHLGEVARTRSLRGRP